MTLNPLNYYFKLTEWTEESRREISFWVWGSAWAELSSFTSKSGILSQSIPERLFFDMVEISDKVRAAFRLKLSSLFETSGAFIVVVISSNTPISAFGLIFSWHVAGCNSVAPHGAITLVLRNIHFKTFEDSGNYHRSSMSLCSKRVLSNW